MSETESEENELLYAVIRNGRRVKDYVVVLHRDGVEEAAKLGLPTFWPSEIKLLQRMRDEKPEMIKPALMAKLGLSIGQDEARITSRSIALLVGAQDLDWGPRSCSHAEDPLVAEWVWGNREGICARCFFEGRPVPVSAPKLEAAE